jgi:predicted phosphodiesterase
LPVSNERVKEVVEYSMLNGVEKTVESMNVPRETLNRYKRKYKQLYGDTAGLIGKIREKFSDEQLEHLLSLGGDVKKTHQVDYNFDGEELTLLVMTDTHYGSIFSPVERTYAAFEEAEKRGCDAMLHIGDVVEGHMSRPNSIYEVTHVGYKQQRDLSIKVLSEWKKPMYVISGNHDDSFNNKLGAGLSIVEDICNAIPNATFVGEGEGIWTIPKFNIKVRMFHGIDAGSSYALSYRLQRIINNMTPAQKPHILLTGHDHKSFNMFYRNVHAIACGCLQKQSSWMTLKGIQAMEGFYILKMGLAPNEVKWMEPRFYPFYQ